jgi:hypothetical protein
MTMETGIRSRLEAADYRRMPEYSMESPRPMQPILVEMALLGAALLVTVRGLSMPMTVLAAMRNLLMLPLSLLKVALSALAVFFSMFSVLGRLFSIGKAAASLMVVAAIITRMEALVNRLRI